MIKTAINYIYIYIEKRVPIPFFNDKIFKNVMYIMKISLSQ